MSISDQLNQIRDIYQAWADQNSPAKVQVCSDLVHLWRLLFDSSQTTKILLMYAGEQVRGDFGIAAPLARVDRRFITVVSRGRGMTIDRGDPLTETNQNAPPLFDIVEEIRNITRAIQLDPEWTERPIDYTGIVPFNTEGSDRITDALQIEFSVGTQLNLISNQPDSLAQPTG